MARKGLSEKRQILYENQKLRFHIIFFIVYIINEKNVKKSIIIIVV